MFRISIRDSVACYPSFFTNSILKVSTYILSSKKVKWAEKILHSKGCSFTWQKTKTRDEWIKLFKMYEVDFAVPEEHFSTIDFSDKASWAQTRRCRNHNYKMNNARARFGNKYNKWKLMDNTFMTNRKQRGQREQDDSDIPSIINDLNEEQKREIIEGWIKNQRDKKDKAKIKDYKTLSIKMMARITWIHRTTFYKKKKQRIYKFDFLKTTVEKLFNENKMIYGSRKLSILLSKNSINISDRTLRDYMRRWNLATTTRVSRKKSESKNTKVQYKDLVQRNFNPISLQPMSCIYRQKLNRIMFTYQ